MPQIKNSLLILVFGGFLVLSSAYAQEVPVSALRKDPCPEAQSAMAAAPDDLSKVQADIDRFTLCVERAQLLKRLNDLATENEEDLLGLSDSNPGFTLDNGASFDSLPTFDKNAVINPEGVDVGQADAIEDIAEPEAWLILSINGAGRDLSAKLAKKDGSLAQVKEGESLPDGSLVVSISPVSVSLSEKGENKELSWFEETK